MLVFCISWTCRSIAVVCRLIVNKVQIAAIVPPRPTRAKAQVAIATSSIAPRGYNTTKYRASYERSGKGELSVSDSIFFPRYDFSQRLLRDETCGETT